MAVAGVEKKKKQKKKKKKRKRKEKKEEEEEGEEKEKEDDGIRGVALSAMLNPTPKPEEGNSVSSHPAQSLHTLSNAHVKSFCVKIEDRQSRARWRKSWRPFLVLVQEAGQLCIWQM